MGAIERLGPAYVKVAQALSTRVDLLPPAYLLAIQRLQDRVPPFPDAEAYACIERSFGGRPVGAVFSRLSERAVAAASLGQVYRGTLRSSGQEVAIKVGGGGGSFCMSRSGACCCWVAGAACLAPWLGRCRGLAPAGWHLRVASALAVFPGTPPKLPVLHHRDCATGAAPRRAGVGVPGPAPHAGRGLAAAQHAGGGCCVRVASCFVRRAARWRAHLACCSCCGLNAAVACSDWEPLHHPGKASCLHMLPRRRRSRLARALRLGGHHRCLGLSLPGRNELRTG